MENLRKNWESISELELGELNYVIQEDKKLT